MILFGLRASTWPSSRPATRRGRGPWPTCMKGVLCVVC